MHQVKMKNTCRLIRPKHVSDKANNSYLPYAVPVYYHCHWLCFLAFTYRFVQANKTFKKVVYFDAKKGLGSAQVQPSYIAFKKKSYSNSLITLSDVGSRQKSIEQRPFSGKQLQNVCETPSS